jgi:hypothetical protein
MTDQPTRSEKAKRTTTGNGGAPDLGFWFKANGQALEGWTQSSANMMKAAMELGQEIMWFSQRRFQADMDAWTAFASCRNPVDFCECQRQFVEKAGAQYLEEVNKLSSKMTSIVSDAAGPFWAQPQSPST